MLDGIWGLFLLLPLAAASGWYIRGRHSVDDEVESSPSRLNPDYLRGIGHLVNYESDRAIEAFIRALDVDNDTVETHLALGNLFRRQGEVDRALRVHENLVARPHLSPAHRNQARLELARDYLRAGVLDRAENLFLQLLGQESFLDRASAGLVTIYEQEREWSKAIECTRRLEKIRGYSLRPVIAQYFCELAEDLPADGRRDSKRQYLRQARSAYRGCVRATLLRGALAEQDADWRLAIRIYRQVQRQDADFICEIIKPMRRCYEQLQDTRGYAHHLRELMAATDHVEPHIAFTRLLHEQQRTDEAIAHLSQYLQQRASWIGFHQLLELTEAGTHGGLTGPLVSLRQLLSRIIERRSTYHCGHCGFSGRYLHWQCPRCRQWNSMVPVHDIVPGEQVQQS